MVVGRLAGLGGPDWIWFVGGLRQVLAEPVEATLDHGAPAGDPVLRGAERGWVDAAGARTADLLRADQAASLQHLHVLEHRGQRHVQRPAELAHRSRAPAEPLDHEPPAGICQGLENTVQVRHIVKHILDYMCWLPDSQAAASLLRGMSVRPEMTRMEGHCWRPQPVPAWLPGEPVPVSCLGDDGAVLGNEGIARGGGEHASAGARDDRAVVTMGGEGDPAQLVEPEDVGAGDVAGALRRMTN